MSTEKFDHILVLVQHSLFFAFAIHITLKLNTPSPNSTYIQQEFITKHMYDPYKYFFDRKIAIPNGMLEDCHPFPMPTRQFLEDPLANGISAPSHKAKVDPRDEGEVWRDHLAIAIGADLQGLSFHHHGSAWNTVIFGKKRWIMYDPKRWQDDEYPERQRRVALASPEEWEEIYTTPEWIRKLYPDPFRQYEIKNYGYDCIQHAGEMMYVPRQWMHMVVNIGDTVSVVSEVGLDKGEGKTPDEFLYDPFEDSSDDSEDESDDEGGPEDPELVAMLDEMAKTDRNQAEALYSDIKGERKYRSTLDPEKWQEFSYWDIFAYFGCTRINSRPRPPYSAAKWADIRQFWKDFVKFDANHRPKEYAVDHEATYQFSMEPFEPPVEAFQNSKGRGVRATRDIAKGELVFKGTNNTIVFTQGDTYRRFLFAVYERYGEEAHQVDSETACDLLSWHWVQPLDEDEDGRVAIVGDLDNGSLMNEGRADEEGWDSPNVRCGKEEDGDAKCMMEYYATEDIKRGDELLSDFRELNVENPWSRMGL